MKKFVFIVLISVSASFCSGNDNGIILVLGGGGARGTTHIGVLKVLEEEQIPIKMIIGTSAGAMVGGAYAAGLSPDEMEKSLEDIRLLGLIKIKPFGNLGFVSWENIQLWLKNLLPVENFEDTRVPFYAVATDLSTGEAVLFSSGSLVEAMCASAAIPLVFQPIEKNGKVYVDGGIAADLPIDIARSITEGPIVAVIATGAIDGMAVDSKWDIFSKSFYIMQHREIRLKRHLADVILEPKVGSYSMADLKHYREMIDAGEREARQALPQIKSLLSN